MIRRKHDNTKSKHFRYLDKVVQKRIPVQYDLKRQKKKKRKVKLCQ